VNTLSCRGAVGRQPAHESSGGRGYWTWMRDRSVTVGDREAGFVTATARGAGNRMPVGGARRVFPLCAGSGEPGAAQPDP